MNDKLENFINSQKFNYRPYWVGLKLEANTTRWETGEVFSRVQYNNFNFAMNSFINRNKPCAISRTQRLSYWGKRNCLNSNPNYLCTKWSSSIRPLSTRFENSSKILYLPENGKLKEGTAIYFDQSNENKKTYLFKSKVSEAGKFKYVIYNRGARLFTNRRSNFVCKFIAIGDEIKVVIVFFEFYFNLIFLN